MGHSGAPEEIHLFQSDIIQRLRDRGWFIDCMASNFSFLARRWGCRVALSKRRLGEAHDFWLEDVNRTLKTGIEEGTKELDHFKHASFIAFWLRRMIPINSTYKMDANKAGDTVASDTKRFLQYGNELCALLIGFQLCLFYECSKVAESKGTVIPLIRDRLTYLKSIQFPDNLKNDFAMVLKHKNISPHSLYLLYKSLFATIVQNPHLASGNRQPGGRLLTSSV